MKKLVILLMLSMFSLASFSQNNGYYSLVKNALVLTGDSLLGTTKMSTTDNLIATNEWVLSVAGAGNGWDSLYVNGSNQLGWWYGGVELGTVNLYDYYLAIEDSTSYVTPYYLSEQLATTNNRVSYEVRLPAASTVFDRVNNPISVPVGWTLAVGTSPVDIVITHNLDRRVTYATVFTVVGTEEQQLFNTAAYNGLITPNSNSVRIQSLATEQKEIVIYLNFAQ